MSAGGSLDHGHSPAVALFSLTSQVLDNCFWYEGDQFAMVREQVLYLSGLAGLPLCAGAPLDPLTVEQELQWIITSL